MAPAGLGPGDGNAKGCQDRAGLALQASLGKLAKAQRDLPARNGWDASEGVGERSRSDSDETFAAPEADAPRPPTAIHVLSLPKSFSIQLAGCSAPTIPGPAGRSVTTCRRPVG